MSLLSERKRPLILAVLLCAVGLVFVIAGGYLLLLGGSAYYVFGGVLLLLATWLLWRANGWSVCVYGLFLLGTLIWALFEAGFDGWALTPRLVVPAVFGLWFAMPWVRGWLRAGSSGQQVLTPGLQSSVAISLISLLTILGSAVLVPYSDASAPLPSRQAAGAISEQLVGSENGEWLAYGNTEAGTRFSPLTQLTKENVGDLEEAWTYRTGVLADENITSAMQATPLMVNESLYFCTQTNVVIALDPETGGERWRFDPQISTEGRNLITTCRGVAYAEVADAEDCPKRIITSTFDARLLALDADTGALCASFGVAGEVDLTRNMGTVDPGVYFPSSAPTIVRGNVIIGGNVHDNLSVDEPSGVIRAFDVATGDFAWAWDMGRPGEHGEPEPGEVYTRGTPNSWAPMSGDEELGMVYVPLGNATPDYWGGHRTEVMEQYSTSVVALDAMTGELRWSFQTIYHDVWDYDVASQPTLVDLEVDGEMVPALVQPTKQGQLYLLDRRTGEPLADVAEREVPHANAPTGDWLSPTQPFSTGMPNFPGERLEERDMWGMTPFDQLWCRINFHSLNYEGIYTPLRENSWTLIYPSIAGGMNWGGVSVDPERGVMIVNAINLATKIRLVPRAEMDKMTENVGGHLPLSPMAGTPYGNQTDNFVSPLGVPCNKPPYGIIAAVDLNSKKVLWEDRLGTGRDTGPFEWNVGLPLKIGVPTFGGSIITRSGLVFIGATHERAVRAIDLASGNILWKDRLPNAGIATPMTYISPKSGRQFVVILAGGHTLSRAPLGDYVVAYALPKGGLK